MMTWNGIDLRWAYANLLPAICQQTRCIQLAQDILHDALIRFVVSGSGKVQQPHAYLRTVVKSVLVDSFRDSRRFVPLLLDPAEAKGEPASYHLLQHPLVPSSEDIADLNQRLQALQVIVDALPKKCRTVFWMYSVEGHTQPEIASLLGISLNMVERHMMRALLSLREECEEMLR